MVSGTPSFIDEQLTAIARDTDPASRVLVEDGRFWLEDPLGRVLLGTSRLEAARDLVQYAALLREAVPEADRAAWAASATPDDGPGDAPGPVSAAAAARPLAG